MSELLRRLNLELEEARDPLHRVELISKKGAYLARTGEFESVRRIIDELRKTFADSSSARATARIMLAEGVLHLYENMSAKALERISGAQVLALATKDASLIAISSAWKAHVEFEMSRFDAMVRSLKTAIDYARDADHDALARLAMVLCGAFFLVGDRRSAQHWFSECHDHAQRDGDQASIEALLYNRAAFSFAWLRARNCLSDIDADEISLTRLEIESAKNLQNLTRIKALTNFVHLCSARLLILERKFAHAIEALESVRGARPFAEWNFSQSFVDLEIAYCLFALGSHDEAVAKFSLVDRSRFEVLDVDERLVAAWMWHGMCDANDGYGDAGEARQQFELLVEQYCQSTNRVTQLLSPFAAQHH